MSLSLPARELELAAAAARVRIPLVKLMTYTDRTLGIVSSTLYLSDRPVLYTFDGAVREFEPAIRTVGDVETSIPHIPPDQAGNAGGAGLTLELANVETDAGRLFTLLNAETLRFARIEYSWVHVAPWEGESRYDLRGLGASQHRELWKGEIETPADSEDGASLTLSCRIERPVIPWLYLNDPTQNAVRDLGKRAPIIYGKKKGVRCPGWTAAFSSPLAEALTASTTGVRQFSGVEGFPSSGTIQLGEEQISYSAKSDANGTLTISSRGVGGTSAVAHSIGETAIEVLSGDAVYLAASHEVDAIPAVYVRNPATSELVKLAASRYTEAAADAATIPGKIVASIKMSPSQMEGVLSDLAALDVTQQPARSTNVAVSHAVNETLVGDSPTSGESSVRDGDWGTGEALNTTVGGPSSVGMGFANHGTVVQQTVHIRTSSTGGQFALRRGPGLGTIIATWNTSGTKSFQTSANENDWTIQLQEDPPLEDAFGTVFELWRDVTYVTAPPAVTTQPQVAETGGTKAIVGGSALGFPLEVLADVDGAPAPSAFAAAYALDEGTGWSTADGIHNEDSVTGSRESQKLTRDARTILDDMESDPAATWVAELNCVLANESTVVHSGSGSLKATTNAAGNAQFAAQPGPLPDYDATGKLLVLRVYVENAASLSATDGVSLQASNTTGGDRYRWNFGTNDGLVAGEFSTIVIDLDNDTPDSTIGTGSPIADFDTIRIFFNHVGTASGRILYVDDCYFAPRSCVAQLNATAGVVDLSADSDQYKLAIRGENVAAISSVEVYFSNSVSSGTTRPAAYKKLTIPGSGLSEGAFVDLVLSATDVGVPSVSDVETLGFEIFTDGESALAPSVWIDELRVRDDTAANPYTVAVGTVLEHPEDVWRHLLTERIPDSPIAIDESTLTALSSLMPDSLASVDLRDLGELFWEVVGRYAFETRTSLGVRFGALRFLAAESDYGFPPATVTLTGWRRIRVRGRDGDDAQTEFGAVYDLDPTGVLAEEGFKGSLRADQEVNDLPSKVPTASIDAARTLFGVRPSDLVGFLSQRDVDSVKDAFGFYVFEGIRADDDFYEFESVDPGEAITLEDGDTFHATPDGETSPRKFRCLSRRDPLHGLPSLVAVQVT